MSILKPGVGEKIAIACPAHCQEFLHCCYFRPFRSFLLLLLFFPLDKSSILDLPSPFVVVDKCSILDLPGLFCCCCCLFFFLVFSFLTSILNLRGPFFLFLFLTDFQLYTFPSFFPLDKSILDLPCSFVVVRKCSVLNLSRLFFFFWSFSFFSCLFS